jgi:hypothetical protein
MLDPQLVASTPRGSTIESLGGDSYWICDDTHHCLRVQGLWRAQELVQRAEVLHCHLDQLA